MCKKAHYFSGGSSQGMVIENKNDETRVYCKK